MAHTLIIGAGPAGLTAASMRWAAALALLYAIATPVFYRTAQLNQNLLVTHCAFFAFALLWRPWDDPAAPRRPQYFLAGLLCGWAAVCDYSGVVVVVVLGLYGLARRRTLPAAARSRTDVWRFILGVSLCGAVLMGYQWTAFGDPFYPAQHYMPPAHFTDRGYVGMDWPHADLLWATAFDLRFGLFTSAPVLLLALYPFLWFDPHARLVGRRELWCIGAFCILFFLFCSANQYTRMQFNSGVRHVVPVSPFLFLLAAGTLLQMPVAPRVCVAAVVAYWSWCLAMYRDVEQGWGVFESPLHITLEGVRLPWLKTLEGMGYVSSQAIAIPLLVTLAVIVWLLWGVGSPVASKARPFCREE